MKVIAYLRTSKAEQEYGIDAQRRVIADYARYRGWKNVRYEVEHASARDTTGRPVFARVRGSLRAGDVLVVAKLDRVSRSLCDFALLLADAGKEGWSLVILDLNVDTATETGRFVAQVMAAAAELERARLRRRTREALAEAKARGVHVGRPPAALPEVVAEFMAPAYAEGRSFEAIASDLNRRAIARNGGGVWTIATVRNALVRAGVHRPRSTKPSRRAA